MSFALISFNQLLTVYPVTLGGAALFFAFGLIYLYAASQANEVDIDHLQDHIPSR